MMLLSLGLAACNDKEKDNGKDDGGVSNVISGRVMGLPAGSDYKIVAKADNATTGDEEEIGSAVVADNGSFTLTLPETLDAKYLEPYTEFWDTKTGITVSDKSAKIAIMYFELQYTDEDEDEESDDLFYTDFDLEAPTTTGRIASFVYSDRQFTMKGNGIIDFDIPTIGVIEEKTDCDVSLVKGWNWTTIELTFEIEEEEAVNTTLKLTTKTPTGFQWRPDTEGMLE